jgi:hypothetical protein
MAGHRDAAEAFAKGEPFSAGNHTATVIEGHPIYLLFGLMIAKRISENVLWISDAGHRSSTTAKALGAIVNEVFGSTHQFKNWGVDDCRPGGTRLMMNEGEGLLIARKAPPDLSPTLGG